MTDEKVMIEIRASDGDEFRRLAARTGLDIRVEGESKGLEGVTMLSVAIAIAPGVLKLLNTVLKHFLEQRRLVRLRSGETLIEADSPDDLEDIASALASKADSK